MSEGIGEGAGVGMGFDTARARDWPSVRQFNVFVANRLGGLADVLRRFESTNVRIVSLMVVDSADCAIIRLVVSDPERATEIFQQAKVPFTESDLLVVQLPETQQPLLEICQALLRVEINTHYAYPLLIGPAGHAALAIYVEDHEQAATVLQSQGFVLFTEKDLSDEDDLQ